MADRVRRTGRGRAIGRWLFEWVKSIVIALSVWLVLRTFLIEAFRIPSGSMKNTLLVGDFLFVNKFLYGAQVPLVGARLPAVREPERGDIVVFDAVDDNQKVVKRLVALGGDTVEMIDGRLLLNGEEKDEPYIIPVDPTRRDGSMVRGQMRRWQLPHFAGPVPENYRPDLNNWGPIVVPPDSLLVMGDNRDDSYDGRYWGFLPRANVVGLPVLVYFSYDAESSDRFAAFREVRWKRLFSVPR